MDDGQTSSTDTFSDITGIPEYVTYIVLVYQLVSAVFVIGKDSLIISTILKTRSLHNIHNILIVNLMMADMIGITVYTFQGAGMMVSYIIGAQDPFRCDVFQFFLFPSILSLYVLVMLSVEKFIGIKYALRYKAIVTHHRVRRVIAAGWITALLFRFTRLIYKLAVGVEYDKFSQFVFCSIEPSYIVFELFTTVIPLFLAYSVIITLEVHLSIKAYQLYKKSQGNNGEGIQMPTEKDKTNHHLKPIITLLIIILGNLAIVVVASITYSLTLMVEETSYLMFVKYVILPNSIHLSAILHSLVYGLYFRKIRRSLCRRIKHIVQCCKFKIKMNSISPS